jgi:hypothetical protein
MPKPVLLLPSLRTFHSVRLDLFFVIVHLLKPLWARRRITAPSATLTPGKAQSSLSDETDAHIRHMLPFAILTQLTAGTYRI